MPCNVEQLFSFIQGASIKKDSVYNIWERLGNTGTEEFLEYITSGPQGDRGQSAYQAWLKIDGNAEKTFTQFIDSLKGPTGFQGYMGERGPIGPTGEKGETGPQGEKGADGNRGTVWYSGALITGTETSGTVFSNSGITDALVGDHYINSLTGFIYKCTTAGDASVAEWAYEKSIKGTIGEQGPIGEKGETGDKGPDGEAGSWPDEALNYLQMTDSNTGETVVAVIIDGVFTTMESALQDFTYERDSNFMYYITGWKRTKNGVTSTECIIPNCNRIMI